MNCIKRAIKHFSSIKYKAVDGRVYMKLPYGFFWYPAHFYPIGNNSSAIYYAKKWAKDENGIYLK